MRNMGRKGRETTLEERNIIKNLFEEGKSYSFIGQILKRSRSTIQSIIKKLKEVGMLKNKQRCGRPKKFSASEERKIVRIVKKKPDISASEIASELQEYNNKEVHPKTIRRVLHREGYRCRVARRKPLVSVANKKKRLEFAQAYLNVNPGFWDNVIFSDESKYNIFQSDGGRKVWRKPNTELDPKNIKSTVKHGGGSVMVWGCIASSGVGELVFIDKIMDKHLYLNILKENLQKSAEKLGIGNTFYFQQDRDPKHTAHIVREWILSNTPHILPTPPQSPDMNPIEHVWWELEKRIRKHHITSKDHLKKLLKEEWNKISTDFIKNLTNSMPNRLQAVIRAKGNPTKY